MFVCSNCGGRTVSVILANREFPWCMKAPCLTAWLEGGVKTLITGEFVGLTPVENMFLSTALMCLLPVWNKSIEVPAGKWSVRTQGHPKAITNVWSFKLLWYHFYFTKISYPNDPEDHLVSHPQRYSFCICFHHTVFVLFFLIELIFSCCICCCWKRKCSFQKLRQDVRSSASSVSCVSGCFFFSTTFRLRDETRSPQEPRRQLTEAGEGSEGAKVSWVSTEMRISNI